MKRSVSHVLIVVVVLLALFWLAGLVSAGRSAEPPDPQVAAPQAGAPAVVSYQGQVTVDGVVYAGPTGYFKFAVVDAVGTTTYWSNNGSSVNGSEPTAAVSLAVSNGLFNVLLGDPLLMDALPAAIFSSTESYLRVWFSRTGAAGSFTRLSPDRRIAAAPYALQAQETANADTLDGQHASAFQQHYANVVIVAQSGGDFTAIGAALGGIADASDTNRYLVKVMPGVYSERVTMKPYVDIEGAGELTTRITYTGDASSATGTVVGASNAELRFLTVENTGGKTYATAIYNGSAAPRLTHVTAAASGGTSSYGVYNVDASSPTMADVTATASGGTSSYGVYNNSSSPAMTDVTATASRGAIVQGVRNIFSSPAMTNVTATASGGTAENIGVYNSASSPKMMHVTATASGGTSSYGVYNNSSYPTMADVTATASEGTTSYGVRNFQSSPTMMHVTATASGGTATNYGVYNNASSSPTMTDVTATASGGTTKNIGVSNYSSSSTMTNVTATASGGTDSYGMYNSSSPTIQNSTIAASGGTNNYGIYNEATGGSYMVKVNNSQITGSTNTIRNDSEFVTRVGASQLDGGAVAGGGTVTCAGVYDESYVFSANACP